jgi:uncharacterized integral membrane protein (TIGR00697 family)
MGKICKHDNENQEGANRAAVLLAGAYIAAQMLSDIGSLKIAVVAGLAVDAGTFIYPVTFTLRDMIHKRLGKSAARTVIVLAASSICAWRAIYGLSADCRRGRLVAWEGANVTGNDAFARVLAPAWTVVLASIAAELVSEWIDTEVYHLWTSRVTERFQWSRVLVSNIVSVPVDSLIFSWCAFGLGFGMPAGQVWEIFWFNVAVQGRRDLAFAAGNLFVKGPSGDRSIR